MESGSWIRSWTNPGEFERSCIIAGSATREGTVREVERGLYGEIHM